MCPSKGLIRDRNFDAGVAASERLEVRFLVGLAAEPWHCCAEQC